MQREWWPPGKVNLDDEQLFLLNSLVDQKVAFVPSKGKQSKQISWYSCGPTVYDVSHMGHARNYVTFDILRRVLEDYFGYNIKYVMNVTDVDDKIIMRARRNHLLNEYSNNTQTVEQVLADVREAFHLANTRQQAKVDDAQQRVQELESVLDGDKKKEKQLDKLKMQRMEEQLKLDKIILSQATMQQISEQALQNGSKEVIEQLMEVSRDVLAEKIDREKGAQVTDHSIFRVHAAKFEQEFLKDMEDLGVRPPDVMTRVSEYIPEIVAYVQKIVEQGFAYEVDGSVYFDTASFRKQGHTYGKLEPWSIGNTALAAESEANFEGSHKRSAADFALWKKSKAGEPCWESPWGTGRPGWHIECSAMASEVLGMNIDIHTGGEDLRFPHHDNELAQAEAYYHCDGCKQWVNYFLHSGHLNIEGLKMSKTLKNFITIREALQEFNARQIRLLFLLKAWHKPIMFNNDAREEMKSKEDLLKNFFQNLDVELRSQSPDDETKWGQEEKELCDKIEFGQKQVHEALLDSIDTARAMMVICELVAEVNRYAMSCTQQNKKCQGLLLQKAGSYVTYILAIFGLLPNPRDSPATAFSALSATAVQDKALPKVLDAFAAFRDEIRSMSRGGENMDTIISVCSNINENLQSLKKDCVSGSLSDQVHCAFATFVAEVNQVAQNGGVNGDILNLCDVVRDETMVELGIRLEDRQQGSVWKRDDPDTLKQEIADKKRAQQEAIIKKIEKQVETKERDLLKLVDLSQKPPVQQFFQEKYSVWNGEGYPTIDSDGNALDDKAVKKAVKEIDKYNKQLQPLLKKQEEDGQDWKQKLEAEINSLKEKLQIANS